MDNVFFKQLSLPEPDYALNIGSGSHGEQTGKILIRLEKVLHSTKEIDIVLVEGDTNTVLAGALAAAKLGIRVGHVEAGLRSYDRKMPEEINRVLTDHCSDLLFAPTPKSKQTLLDEGISKDKIFLTGNTIVDAVYQNIALATSKVDALSQLALKHRSYFLVTIHRQENVDNKERFSQILAGLENLHEEFNLPIIYPIHPRAKKQLKTFGLHIKNVETVDPLDYLSFLQLENNAKLILTDSGGVQEEACILGVPCVTLRYNTERPETLEVGANTLAGTNPKTILSKTHKMLQPKPKWKNPFGNGQAANKIVQILTKQQPHPINHTNTTRTNTTTHPTPHAFFLTNPKPTQRKPSTHGQSHEQRTCRNRENHN